ncbi:hypothetical protein CYY_000344 [Polysphondylium violaceum]|uniref:Uncharacterized protein n=1 Tax=Polysphondylium violaceum TaxID=133409 RepID=A0A8J4V2I4_9MYCE|nr:hypothetical protein CYY_000344 [Polysphondylium violaceum]
MDISNISEEELKETYFDVDKDILGCKHYPRACKIKAACCGKFFTCRFCHNEKENKHDIDRHATKFILCMKCKIPQLVSNQCINPRCETIFARYYCFVCKFYDDTPNKKIFHCQDCGICRVGSRDDFKHCSRCNMCLGVNTFDSHKCMEGTYLNNCPVCMEDLFSSRDSTVPLRCGHPLHFECYNQFIKANHYQCPVCKKSIANLANAWKRYDRLIESSPMPAMYKGSTASITCNDCHVKTMDMPLHFIGLKCSGCGGYNTTVMSQNVQIDQTLANDPNQSIFRVNEGDDVDQVSDDEEDDEDDDDENQDGVYGVGEYEGDEDDDEELDYDDDDDDDNEDEEFDSAEADEHNENN